MKMEILLEPTSNKLLVGYRKDGDRDGKSEFMRCQGLYVSKMERGFLSQKGSGGGRGVKEKKQGDGGAHNRNKKNISLSIGVSTDSEDIMNDDTPLGVASAVHEGVIPSVVGMTFKMGKQNSLDDTNVPESFPPLSTPVTTTAANALGKSSYANITGKPSGKEVNVHTLFTPGGNGIDVVVPKVAYPVVANYVRNTWGKYGLVRSMFSSSTRLFSFQFSSMDRLDAMLENGPWSSYARVTIELRADKELKDNIVVAMPKITSGNKKKGVEPTIEVSNSNPFDVLNSVDNDVEFGTNEGTTNLVNNGATSSGSSFMNIDNDGEFASNTPIGEKIDKIKRQICEGKLRLMDNDGNPLVLTGIVESDSEVEMVFDETTNLRISASGKDRSDKGYGTNSLLEQWRDSYPDNDDYDPYDDDMYDNHDLSEHLQSICDDLDITVCGRKKK
ncbi:hypothetical protein Tco_0428929 [Tanacetum coccineum]